MKNSLTSALFFAAAILLAGACNSDKPQTETTQPVALETLKIEKKTGPDCDKPDTLRLSMGMSNDFEQAVAALEVLAGRRSE